MKSAACGSALTGHVGPKWRRFSVSLPAPPDLLERFGTKLDLRIADLAERLACTGEGGCGSHAIAVFPHLYGLPSAGTTS
jgi:hypothetical protein